MNGMLSERQQETIFKRLVKREENSYCADCHAKGASWTSLGFGIFVCISCSGIHRSFGMHITRVRSTKLDCWTKKDVKLLELVGNKTANAFYEYKIKKGVKNEPFRDKKSMLNFLRNKYEDKIYAKPNSIDPITLVIKKDFKISKRTLSNFYLDKQIKNESQGQKIIKQDEQTIHEDLDFLNYDFGKSTQKQPKNEDQFLEMNLDMIVP